MAKCVECGKETSRSGVVCRECLNDVVEEAEREGLPLVGGRAATRPAGFHRRAGAQPYARSQDPVCPAWRRS